MAPMRRLSVILGLVALVSTACSSRSSPDTAGASASQEATTFALQVATPDLYIGAPQRVQVGVFGSSGSQGVELLTGGSIPLSLVGADGGDPITGTATYVPAPGTASAKEPSLTAPADARGVGGGAGWGGGALGGGRRGAGGGRGARARRGGGGGGGSGGGWGGPGGG